MPDLTPGYERFDRGTIQNIREYGFSVICTAMATPHWQRQQPKEVPLTYTVGLYETYGGLELICCGLPNDVAGILIHTYVDRYTAKRQTHAWGVPIPEVCVRELVCQLQPIAPRFQQAVLTQVHWFYDDSPVPVGQLICPDGRGHWPWDAGYTRMPPQPLLTVDGRPVTAAEAEPV